MNQFIEIKFSYLRFFPNMIHPPPLHALECRGVITSPPVVMSMMQSSVKGALLNKVLDSAQKQPQLIHPVQGELEFAVSCEVEAAEG